jgi:hypothetical protein
MSSRWLVVLLAVQTLLLVVLVADRLVPEARAADGVHCEIVNWPGALTGQGLDAVRVRVDEVRSPVPVQIQGWNTSDQVPIVVKGWQTYDRVKVER